MSDLLSLVHAHYDALSHGDLDGATAPSPTTSRRSRPAGPSRDWRRFVSWERPSSPPCPTCATTSSGRSRPETRSWSKGVYSGTHTGPLVGPQGAIPPSGNAFAFPYADFLEVKDGKCVSHRIYWDNVTFLAQIGAIPAQ